jgi:alpha-beta hydrolase superfamily lysophospholipase
VGDEPVGFETEDGVVVRGHLFEPTGPRRKVAVLAHASTNDQRAWTGFAQELARQGIAALTFDFRGFGETGGQRDIANVHRDLDAAVRFLRSRDYTQVYIIGEEMGGTAALKVAARQDLAGVVTLSARLSIMGLTAEPDLASVTEPKLFLVAQGDAQGATAAAAFMSATPGQKDSHVFAGSAIGVSLLQGATGEAVRQRILQFLNP